MFSYFTIWFVPTTLKGVFFSSFPAASKSSLKFICCACELSNDSLIQLMLPNLHINKSFKTWPFADIFLSSWFLGCMIFFMNLVLCSFCRYTEAWGRSFLRSSFSPLTTRTNPGSGSDKASQAPTWAAFLAEEIPQCSSCGRNLTISICLQCLLTLNNSTGTTEALTLFHKDGR